MGVTTVVLLFILITESCSTGVQRLYMPGSVGKAGMEMEALNAVLEAASHPAFVVIVTEKRAQFEGLSEVAAPWGVGVFEVATDGQDANKTQAQLSQVVSRAHQLRWVSWFITVVVVSDDPAFLVEFTEWSFKSRLLVWSTKLLILTRFPLHSLSHIRSTLAMTNSMLVILTNTSAYRCFVYVELPYNAEGSQPHEVGTCPAQKNRTFTPRFPLFPEKFEKLANGPTLKATYVEYSSTKRMIVDDPGAPGGKRIIILDPEIRLFELIAQNMNFTFEIDSPADEAWGVEMPNGSFTGMVGMLQRKEVDLSLSLLHTTFVRHRVVDFTFPLTVWHSRIVVQRKDPEVDPWGFVLPMTPLVWLALFLALIVVLLAMVMLSTFLSQEMLVQTKISPTIQGCLRVLLQEDLGVKVRGWWWWQRVVLGVWMMMVLVTIQSYVGNLMSLLAVRYTPLPIQMLKDILHNPVIVVTPKGTTQASSFLDAERGLLRQIADLRHEGRFQPVYVSELNYYLDHHVRRGTHVLVLLDSRTTVMVANDFSDKGRCDFYHAKEEILPMLAAIAVPKGSPLLLALNSRVLRVVESGIYYHWLKLYTPNFTSCLNPPKKVAVRTKLGLTNLWGMFVVQAAGYAICLLIFCLECLYPRLCR